MANLHKTEKKLPWLVRDGGLPSDWLGGRIGGILCSHTVKLVWHARHRRNARIHPHVYPITSGAEVSLQQAKGKKTKHV